MRSRPPIQRGGIYWLDWNPSRGSEQAGRRPSLVVQTDDANLQPGYPVTIVVAVSGSGHPGVPVHVPIVPSRLNGLAKESFVRCEQILTVSLDRFEGRIGTLEPRTLTLVDAALRRVLGLGG